VGGAKLARREGEDAGAGAKIEHERTRCHGQVQRLDKWRGASAVVDHAAVRQY
jgi:hypothetical protein